MGPSRVNFRVGTLSTKQRVSSRWSNEVPLKMPPRHLTALSGNAASSRKRGKNAKQAPPRRLTPGEGFFADEQSPLQAYRDCRTNDLSVGADGKDKPQPSALAERRRYLANYVNWLRPWSSSSRRWRGPGSSLFQTKAKSTRTAPPDRDRLAETLAAELTSAAYGSHFGMGREVPGSIWNWPFGECWPRRS